MACNFAFAILILTPTTVTTPPCPQPIRFAGITYQKIDSKWHNDDGDQQIGYSQWHYKIIRNRLQRTLPADGQDDEDVAEERQDGEQYQYQRPIVVVHCRREKPKVSECESEWDSEWDSGGESESFIMWQSRSVGNKR